MKIEPEKDLFQTRFELYNLRQESGQSVSNFVPKPKAHASMCKFGNEQKYGVLVQCVICMCNVQLQSIILSELLRPNKAVRLQY